MKQTGLKMRKKWETIERIRVPSRIEERNPIKTFCLDYNKDGRKEFCIQLNRYLICIQPDSEQVTTHEVIVVPYAVDGPSEAYLEADNSRLSLVNAGKTIWRIDTAKRFFGFGIGRDDDDTVTFGLSQMGRRQQAVSILSLELMTCKTTGVTTICLFNSDGRMLMLNPQGNTLFEKQLMEGRFEQARFFIAHTDVGPRIYLSAYRHYKRVMKFWQTIDLEWHTFEFVYEKESLKLVQTYPELGILNIGDGTGDYFIDENMGKIARTEEKLNLESEERMFYRVGLRTQNTLAIDPMDPSRAQVIEYQEDNSIRATNIDGKTLWSQKLDTIGSLQWLSAVMGVANSSSERMLAMFYETARTLDGYAATNKEYHIRIFFMGGTRIGEFDFPLNTEETDVPVLLLHDIDDDECPELLVISNKGLSVFALGETALLQTSLHEHRGVGDDWPDFPLPAENLWDTTLSFNDPDRTRTD
jgi:hypothetical protein